MSQTKSLSKILFFSLLVLIILGFAQSVNAAGNKKFMSIKKAKAFAQRAIIESVIGLKVQSNALWSKDETEDNYQIKGEVSANIKGIIFDAPKYDKAKDIAMVTAKIRLGSVKNVIGKPIHYDDLIISRVGFATSSPEYAPQLAALRAAELNAFDEMAQLIVGQEISSKTKVRNFVLASDEVRTKTQAAIWGSEIQDFGWEEDGTAYIKLKLNVKYIEGALGQSAKSSNSFYEVTGYGATHDDASKKK